MIVCIYLLYLQTTSSVHSYFVPPDITGHVLLSQKSHRTPQMTLTRLKKSTTAHNTWSHTIQNHECNVHDFHRKMAVWNRDAHCTKISNQMPVCEQAELDGLKLCLGAASCTTDSCPRCGYQRDQMNAIRRVQLATSLCFTWLEWCRLITTNAAWKVTTLWTR